MTRSYPVKRTTVAPTQPAPWRTTQASRARGLARVQHELGSASKGKGKGKALDQDAPEPATPWKQADALLGHSFNLHRLSPLHAFPLASSPTPDAFAAFAKQLKAFLSQQLALASSTDDVYPGEAASGGSGRSTGTITRVEAGLVDCHVHGSANSDVLPILIEVDRGTSYDDEQSPTSTVTSSFILIPSLSTPSNFPLLLSKTPYAPLASLVLTYLTTRHDSHISPLVIPPSFMTSLLSSLVANAPLHSEATLPTTLTFAFPPSLAKAGLSSTTLTIPPPLLSALTTPPSPSSFVDSLEAYFDDLTSLSLRSMFLVRLGAGRGTFVHSGIGTAGGVGVEAQGKIKFYKAAGGDEGELESVLEQLVQVAEEGKRGVRNE